MDNFSRSHLFFAVAVLAALLGASGCSGDGEDSFLGRDCRTSSQCGADEYCHFSNGVCGEGTGFCDELPEACAEIFSPVCGCDGRSYPNACEAAVAGISVGADTACAVLEP